MKIVTKIYGSNSLVKKLTEKGVTAKLTKGNSESKVIVDLPIDTVIGSTKFYKIIPEVLYDLGEPNENFFIQLSSCTLKGEYSTVVCDRLGRMLKPFFVPRVEADSERTEDGMFCSETITTVQVARTDKGNVVSIKKHVIVPIFGQYLFVSSQRMYHGKISGFPEELADFLPAVNVAMKNIYGENEVKNIRPYYEA